MFAFDPMKLNKTTARFSCVKMLVFLFKAENALFFGCFCKYVLFFVLLGEILLVLCLFGT